MKIVLTHLEDVPPVLNAHAATRRQVDMGDQRASIKDGEHVFICDRQRLSGIYWSSLYPEESSLRMDDPPECREQRNEEPGGAHSPVTLLPDKSRLRRFRYLSAIVSAKSSLPSIPRNPIEGRLSSSSAGWRSRLIHSSGTKW